MGLLSLVQKFCQKTGLTVPSLVIGSTDPQIKQMLQILNEGVLEIAQKYPWPQLQMHTTFSTLPNTVQGDVETLFPGFVRIMPDSVWNQTTKLPCPGAFANAETMATRLILDSTTYQSWRIFGQKFEFLTPPPEGHSIQVEYLSSLAIVGVDSTRKSEFSLDTDNTIFPEMAHSLDFAWRWLAAKGLPYAEQMATSERFLRNLFLNNRQARTLYMAGEDSPKFGILVKPGYWET